MKNYEEMARDLLARRDVYEQQQKRKKRRREKVVLCAVSIALLLIGGFGIWKSSIWQHDLNNVPIAGVEMQEEKDRSQMQTENSETEEKEEINIKKKETGQQNYPMGESEDITRSSSKKKNEVSGKDKSVNAVNPFRFKREDYNKVVEEDLSDGEVNRESLTDNTSLTDLTYLSEQATEIAAGTIKKITYDIMKGEAWTKVDIQVTNVFKGSLITGDIISIYRLGGYISLKEYKKYHKDVVRFMTDTKEIEHILLKQVYEGEEFPKQGEKSVFYLKRTPSHSSLPKGAYERIAGKYGELQIIEDNLLQYRDNDKISYTWKEIQQNANK